MKVHHRPVAGLATLALALPAAADIIYSGFQDIGIPADYDGLYLNVETGTWNTNMFSPVAGWDINPFFGGSVVANSPAFQPVRAGTGNMDAILNLATGTTVGSGSVFSTFTQGAGGENPGAPGYGGSQTHLGGGAGQFTAGSEGYLGFRINGSNYGWMRVVFTNNAGGAVIRDWAYDNGGASIATGNVAQSGSTVTLDSTFGSFTLGSTVGGSNSLVKTGSNTATLNGTHAYSGTTTVSQGTLSVNGAITATSGTSVASGATSGGTGTLAGTVTADSGSFVAPGNSVGELGLTDLDLAGALVIEWDNLANFDLLNVSGDLNLLSGSALTFSGNEGDLNINSAYVFATYSSLGGTGTFTTINNLPTGFSIDYAYNGNQIALVPEPRAALLGFLGLLALLRRRRVV